MPISVTSNRPQNISDGCNAIEVPLCSHIGNIVWNIFYFSIYWEYTSQLTNIFQGGRYTTNQISMSQTFHRWSRFSRPSVIISWSRFPREHGAPMGSLSQLPLQGYTHFRLSSASASWNESIYDAGRLVNAWSVDSVQTPNINMEIWLWINTYT